MTRPLPKTQQELLDAMKAGVVVHREWFCAGHYYVRGDNLSICTTAAVELLSKGLAVTVDKTIVPAPVAMKPRQIRGPDRLGCCS